MTASRRRLLAVITATLAAVACDIDELLEGGEGDPKPISVSVALQDSTLSIAPGTSVLLVVTVTRLDERRGELTFSMSVPVGFSWSVTSVVESGAVTTAEITISAAASLEPSMHLASLRVTGEPRGGSTTLLALVVVPHPALDVTPSEPEVTLIPGGISPLAVLIVRTGITGPVSLTLVAPQGITLAAPNEPVAGSSATLTLAVAGSVAPGTYPTLLRASAPGVPSDDAALTVRVSADPLQLILDDVAAAQATLVSTEVIVNRNGVAGAVNFSAEDLPAGVAFAADPALGTLATVEFTVTAGAAPGSYPVTLRATDGSQSAATTFQLTVAPSNVGVTLVPQQIAVLPGSGGVSVLTLVRTSFDGLVSVGFAGVPAGISIAVADPTVAGTSTTLTVVVAEDVAPGIYDLTIRATPLPVTGGPGGPALDPVTAPLTLTVVEPPAEGGNVILDWSGCAVPAWVAGQDGDGPWAVLAGVQGRFGLSVTSGRGGIAYSTGPVSLVVRFAAQAEWTSAPVDMCPPEEPPVARHTITGDANFTGINTSADYTWSLGGGVGTSTLAAPGFTIPGVREGVHDLIGVGTIGAGRGPVVIARGVNVSASTYIGSVPVLGEFAVTPVNANLRIGVPTGERLFLIESYITTPACLPTAIFSTSSAVAASGYVTLGLLGVPAAHQGPLDFHLVEVSAVSTAGTRVASLAFHGLAAGATQDVSLPPELPGYAVTPLLGSHQRLRLTLEGEPVGYSSDLSLRFDDGQSAVTVLQSAAARAAFAGAGIVLEMPELGGLPGFPAGAVPRSSEHGNWTIAMAGTNNVATLCAEGASRWSIERKGAY